jgi:hypothetical protein
MIEELQVAPSFGEGVGLFTAGWELGFKNIEGAWKDTVKSIESTIPVVPGAPTAAAPTDKPNVYANPNPAGAYPFATGGRVPGVGSSDTVPAMLTPGEFVNRKSSVNYYGADIFRALNNNAIPRSLFGRIGYAMGGLVSPAQHFASGGMVETAGGRVFVDLHMHGQTFTMSSDQDVADRLVRFARSESMRSAGIKPGWVS